MATVDNIRTKLIDKILTIKNTAFLEAHDQLISSRTTDSDIEELSKDQISMLKMSENDTKNGRLISQEAMNKRNHYCPIKINFT